MSILIVGSGCLAAGGLGSVWTWSVWVVRFDMDDASNCQCGIMTCLILTREVIHQLLFPGSPHFWKSSSSSPPKNFKRL